MAAVIGLVKLSDGIQPETDFQMPTSALQRLLPVISASRNAGFSHIAVILNTETVDPLMLPPYSSPRPSRNKPPGPLMAPAALVRPAAS